MELTAILEPEADKALKYKYVLDAVQQLLGSETDTLAILANTTALLKDTFGWHWVGWYRVIDENNLVLGPFQGPLACTRIAKGRGVCGAAWKEEKIQIVPNVHHFPGHIACSALSNSEVVVPLWDANNNIVGVLDIDSVVFNDFDETDSQNLLALVAMLKPLDYSSL